MSGLYAGSIKKVHFNQDDKDSVVDIYVSAESLRVYDNPWVEDTSPPAGIHHTGKRMGNKCQSKDAKFYHRNVKLMDFIYCIEQKCSVFFYFSVFGQ